MATSKEGSVVTSGSFSVEEVARHPLPGMAIPDQIRFSPGDQWITFLWSPERTLERQLYCYDPQTGSKKPLIVRGGGTTEENVSLAEALRRERMRQREIGITTYSWAKSTLRVLVPIKNDLCVQDGPDAPLRTIYSSEHGAVHCPRLSPDGSLVAYVADAELYVISTDGGAPIQITSGARGTGKTHGLAEYVAQEEMGRHDGFWWSPCGQRIAFTEVDETHIPIYRIMHQGKAATGEGAEEDHHYPFTGKENAKVRLAVVSVEGGQEPVFMDTQYGEETYLARVGWLRDGRLVAQIQDRRQSWLELVAFDLETGKRTVLLREETKVWINLHDLLRPLEDGGFLWASERNGYRHIYRYDKNGTLLRQITHGAWMVDDIRGIDEKHGRIFFTSTAESPLESHLYVVSLDGGDARRITTEPGMHGAICDQACERFVDVHHNLGHAPTIKLRSLETGAVLATIFEDHDPRIESLGLTPPELVTFPSRDGEKLFGAVYKPAAKYGSGPHPTIVYVYGGPHVQLVTNGWTMTVMMRAQYLRSLGFLVFIVDNRGSARRGLAFEGAIKHRMGSIEVDDQVDGVRWLVSQGLTDPNRVGVCGWSYGGYMSLMCLARAPETFHVAVAGAPVTHWDGYDTHYTERYMGLPEENARGYEDSSVMHHVGGIRGKLMLVHGMIDENVHFRHTARLINALISARKPYDLLAFPDERHMPRKMSDKVYMEELVGKYFVDHLK